MAWRVTQNFASRTPRPCAILFTCARPENFRTHFRYMTMGKQFAARLHLHAWALDHLQRYSSADHTHTMWTWRHFCRTRLFDNQTRTEIGIMLFLLAYCDVSWEICRWRALICIILIVISLLFAMRAASIPRVIMKPTASGLVLSQCARLLFVFCLGRLSDELSLIGELMSLMLCFIFTHFSKAECTQMRILVTRTLQCQNCNPSQT